MGHKIGYARVSTDDQDPQLQLDALAAEGCLKIYKDVATGTKPSVLNGRPVWVTFALATPSSSGRSTGSAATCATSWTSSPSSKNAVSASSR